MKIIVGLGNVGDGYAHTYHNLGFLTVECLASRLKTAFSKKECGSITAHADLGGQRVILAKPQTMMNRSGSAVQKLLGYYKCGLSDLIVIYDDIDIERGALRYRETGSAGTHNGMRDIVLYVGEEFKRIRIGTGRPADGRDLASYVLSVIPKDDRPLFVKAIEAAADKALELV